MKNGAWVKVGHNQKLLDPPLSLRICSTFGSRLRGFLFTSPPSLGEGLLFEYAYPSRIDTAIHMVGVPFPLAAIWLNSQQRVVDKRIAYPWQIAIIPKQAARYVVECHPQRLDQFIEGERYDFLEG